MTIDANTTGVLLGAILALQAWQLNEIIRLKIRVAEMDMRARLVRQYVEPKQTSDTDFFY